MFCRTMLLCCTVVAATLSFGTLHARQVPLYTLLITPEMVVRAIDGVTRRDSVTNGEATIGSVRAGGKLLVARSRMDVALVRSSANWRGRIVVKLRVPTEITYSVDLRAIRAREVVIDPRKRLLTLTVPQPSVEDVVPVLAEMTTEERYLALRLRRFDRAVSLQMQIDALKKELQPQARLMASAAVGEIREQAREVVVELLKNLFAHAGVDVKVVFD